MTTIAYHPTYSAAQHRAFFEHPPEATRIITPKGRRAGFTRGGMQAAIGWALAGEPVLWGDTVLGNIRKYVERYALPLLNAQRVPYEWHLQDKVMKFPTGGFIDFRSADNTENWEGFGYRRILLNEAGIIFQGDAGKYLYLNSVLPMLADFDDAVLYAFGVPKGTAGLYNELYQVALSDDPLYHTETFTGWDNPWVSEAVLNALKSEMFKLGGQDLVDQEMLGKFVNIQGGGLRVIPEAWVRLAQQRWKDREQPPGKPDALGVDVARGGQDTTALAPRWGTYFGRIDEVAGRLTPDGPSVRDLVVPRVEPRTRAVMDIVGIGSSPYDFTKLVHANTVAFNGGAGSDGKDRTGNYGFANLRAEAYWRFREALDPDTGEGLALPPDEELVQDLISVGWEPRREKILIEDKGEIKKRIGRSTNRGDAVVMAWWTDLTGTPTATTTRAAFRGAALRRRSA